MKTTISLILALMYFLPIQTEAKVPYNSQFCDLIWNANFEMEVDGEKLYRTFIKSIHGKVEEV